MYIYIICVLSKPVYKNMHKPIIHKDNTQTNEYKQKRIQLHIYIRICIFYNNFSYTYLHIKIYNRAMKDLNIKKLVSKIC